MVSSLIGILLLGLLLVDVFGTVFHPQGLGGPINRRQNRLVWRVYKSFGKRSDGSTRHRVLASAAPALIVLTLFGWFVVLTFGFALIYLPHIDSFLFSSGSPRGRWIEAIYYSGYTAATLGLGDMVPDSRVLRIITPIQAFSGFALVSVSVTYLLATYRELIAMRTTAANINGYFGTNELDRRGLESPDAYEAMARWSELIAGAVLQTLQAHFQYPVLHYFRPSDTAAALPVQMERLRSFIRRHEDATGEGGSLVSHHPSFRALAHALDEFSQSVERYFVPPAKPGQAEGEGPEPTEAHHRLLEYMLYR